MGFFKRLVTPAGEVAFVDGCRELVKGRYNAALPHFEQCTHLVDGAFAAGFIALKQENAEQAIRYLKQAEQEYRQLGKTFAKYGMTLTLDLPISDHVEAHVGATLRGVLLTLVEACQFAGDMQEAYEHIHRLRGLEPDDVVILLSEVELLWEANTGDKDTCEHIVQLTKDVTNKCHIHTTLMLYKARALAALGMHTAARDVLTTALRRRKDRPVDLLNALLYERANVYEALGQGKRARGDLETIYAADPGYDAGYRILEGGADNDDVYTFALFHHAALQAVLLF
jgi:tetratricopeptide (TPR) repeat protein